MRFWLPSHFSFIISFYLLKRAEGTPQGTRGRGSNWKAGHSTLGYFNHVITCWDQMTNCVMIPHWACNANFDQTTDFRNKFSRFFFRKSQNCNIRLSEISWHSWSYDLSLWSHDWNILRSNVLLSIASAANGCRPKYTDPGVWQTRLIVLKRSCLFIFRLF